jgi:CRISPR/Cas system-associated exonuclease Cas4 (RecB family)
MASALVNEYLAHNIPTEVEQSLVSEIKDGVYLGGTCDSLTNDIIVDYKNVATKPKTDKIPWNYYIQLMAYAYLYRAKGVDINRLRIVYTVRPTKTMGVRVFVVDHQVTQSDWQAIEDVLTLIADSYLLAQAKPEYTHLLFKSMALKV